MEEEGTSGVVIDEKFLGSDQGMHPHAPPQYIDVILQQRHTGLGHYLGHTVCAARCVVWFERKKEEGYK